jgi:hypothetical protein
MMVAYTQSFPTKYMVLDNDRRSPPIHYQVTDTLHFPSTYFTFIYVFTTMVTLLTLLFSFLYIFTIPTDDLLSVVSTHPTESKHPYTYLIHLLTLLFLVIFVYNRFVLYCDNTVVSTHPTEIIFVYNRLWAPSSPKLISR